MLANCPTGSQQWQTGDVRPSLFPSSCTCSTSIPLFLILMACGSGRQSQGHGGSNPENQRHLHVVPCEDAELAMSMEITSSLRHSLQSRSEWKGVGQSANHSCCKRHQNVELQFITVQAMQEDDDGNALTSVKPDVAAVLRAKREIQPGEFIRYQYTVQSEHLKRIFECECFFHNGLCQPHGQKSMLERLAAVPKPSSV